VKFGKLDPVVCHPLAGNIVAGAAGDLRSRAFSAIRLKDVRAASSGLPGPGVA